MEIEINRAGTTLDCGVIDYGGDEVWDVKITRVGRTVDLWKVTQTRVVEQEGGKDDVRTREFAELVKALKYVERMFNRQFDGQPAFRL